MIVLRAHIAYALGTIRRSAPNSWWGEAKVEQRGFWRGMDFRVWYRLSAFQYNIAMRGFLLLNVSFPIVLSFLSNSLLIFVRVSAMENHLDITACEDVPVEKEGSYLRVRLSIPLVASPLCALLLLYIQKNLTLHPAR